MVADSAMDLAGFNQLFQAWLHRYNWEFPHRSLPDRVPPASVYFEAPGRIQRPLQTLVDWNRWINTRAQRKVTKCNAISVKGESYPVPPGYAGCRVDVVEMEEVVEVYHHDQLIASIPVDPARFLPGNARRARRVAKNGIIRYGGKYYTVDYKLAGKSVEVREVAAGTELLVYLNGVLVKSIVKK